MGSFRVQEEQTLLRFPWHDARTLSACLEGRLTTSEGETARQHAFVMTRHTMRFQNGFDVVGETNLARQSLIQGGLADGSGAYGGRFRPGGIRMTTSPQPEEW